jgi:hypothetical protein
MTSVELGDDVAATLGSPAATMGIAAVTGR